MGEGLLSQKKWKHRARISVSLLIHGVHGAKGGTVNTVVTVPFLTPLPADAMKEFKPPKSVQVYIGSATTELPHHNAVHIIYTLCRVINTGLYAVLRWVQLSCAHSVLFGSAAV